MSLTGSLSDLQISIPFFVPSVSEQGPGLGSGRSQGVCEARASVGCWEPGLLRLPGDHQESPAPQGTTTPAPSAVSPSVSPQPSLSIKAQLGEVRLGKAVVRLGKERR